MHFLLEAPRTDSHEASVWKWKAWPELTTSLVSLLAANDSAGFCGYLGTAPHYSLS